MPFPLLFDLNFMTCLQTVICISNQFLIYCIILLQLLLHFSKISILFIASRNKLMLFCIKKSGSNA